MRAARSAALLQAGLVLWLVVPACRAAWAGDLLDETMLHPGDAFTAHTFAGGELAYHQAPTPYPSWAFWGITDWLTVELDFEAWLGGVPSLNARARLRGQRGAIPAIAYETMFQYLGEEIDLLEDYSSLSVRRHGASWSNRINLSWSLSRKLALHASGGATYSRDLSIDNADVEMPHGNRYQRATHPDGSLAIDWRVARWASLHATASHGSTFLYVDNVPRKRQAVIATRLAPCLGSRHGFLRKLRLELALVSMRFEDADETLSGPMGFVYWQWGLPKPSPESP